MPQNTEADNKLPAKGNINNAFLMDNFIKDEAILKNISNESVNLSFNLQRTSKATMIYLKKLENLLFNDNFLSKQHEITQILDQLTKNDLFNYKNEENEETFLHQLINRPKSFANEQALIHLFFKFVDKGCNLNAVDGYSWTCLHYCCVYNKAELAKQIINHEKFDKLTINAKSSKQLKTDTLYYLIGTTPLQICAWLNNLVLAKKLIKHGANIHDKNEAGWTCLHICARQAYPDFIVYLIEKGANVNEGNNHEKTPLHVSSRHGHASIAELLLKARANVALVNNYGQSPLYVAVTKSHIDVINLLIEYGSDVNQTDKQQNNPLHACALLKETRSNSYIDTDVTDYDTSLINVKIGELLFSKGCNAVKQNYLGRTPLHYAAKNNCFNFAAMLLSKAPVSLNMRDIYGQTALYIACKWKSDNVSRLLLNKKANKDISDLTGKTPLHLCAQEGSDNARVMSTLFRYGDDVNKASIGKDNDTPLHIAARNNNAEIIEFLLDNNADVNKTNKNGETALHISAQHGSYESCMILLDGGAKINKTTKTGLTPLHSSILASKNSVQIASILIDYGVGINQEDDDKITPLSMSTIRGNFGIVNLLIEKKAKIINSNYESVAHICANKNQCDPNCFKLLISTYGFNSLFDYSLTNYRTPFQLCVEKKSQIFLKAVMSCENIKCIDWFKSLHSTRGFGVSPIVMAVTSQNYAFIQELIHMWFQLFHDEHHSFVHDADDIPVINTFRNRIKKFFSKTEDLMAKPRRESILSTLNLHLHHAPKAHGCSSCQNEDICLFKPNWDDPEQTSGKYFLNVLIRENPQLTNEVLNTFMKTDILQWQTYIYLDHLEPWEDTTRTNLSLHDRPFTPLETIYVHNKYQLVTHPVVKTLINEKLRDYAKLPLFFDMIRQIGLLIVWTAFACIEDYSILHSYNRSNRIGKIILLVLCVLFFLWEVTEELMQVIFTQMRINGHKSWINKRQNENLNALNELISDREETINDSKRSKTEPEKTRRQTLHHQGSVDKQRNKYFLIEKEIRAINNLISPYRRADNVFDWITCGLMITTLITHFVDINQHTDLLARIHIIISTINVIVIWLRELLVVNGLIPATNLVCMLRLLGFDILRFAFLFIRIYIPFMLLFWTLFSGPKVPETIMQTYWKECEHIIYSLPYEGSFNLTTYQPNTTSTPFDCTPSVNVNGFENFYDTLYSVFRFIVIDNYDFDSMKSVQNVLAPIICSIFLILSAVIGVNFFIGLMSNVLSEGAYTNIEAHRSMELLGYVLRHEWRLSKKMRQKHLNKIKTTCSPKILRNNQVITEATGTGKPNNLNTNINSNLNKQFSSIHERFEELQTKLEKDFSNWRINQLQNSNSNSTPVEPFSGGHDQNEKLLLNMKHDVSQLKNDISEIKNLLKSQLNFH